MMIEKEKQTIDSCRFCWMCRHVCPIGNVTGRERNNARARALTLSVVLRGAAELSEDIVANVYECAMCGACVKECVTGWDPLNFTRAVKADAAVAGVTPPYITRLIENNLETGNPYGIKNICDELAEKLPEMEKMSGTLLFLGTDARFKCAGKALKAAELINKSGEPFAVLKDEPDSGYMMDFLLGKIDETSSIMKKAAEVLNRYETVICYDPADAKIFMREYKEWGIDIRPVIKTFTAYIAGLVRTGALKPVRQKRAFVFQDPAHLSRDLEETEEARFILNACGETYEMLLNGKDTMWAGNLIMKEYMPDVIKRTALERWKNAMSTGADVLVTASPSEYQVLSMVRDEAISATGGREMGLESIEETVLKSLR
ncbi:MAG: (Fe-S)-binding protein [Eubacteriales bacterium]|nr:(Fe-S)-binding protein [Eubacteriales bacterium]